MKNQIKTLGELKNSGYQYKTVHQELRLNLKERIRSGEKVFQGIIGYDDTVLPDLERAILAGHSINFLGLRGQAKTKMARLLVQLFDDYVPKVKGSPLNEDPLMPLTETTKKLIVSDLKQAKTTELQIITLNSKLSKTKVHKSQNCPSKYNSAFRARRFISYYGF